MADARRSGASSRGWIHRKIPRASRARALSSCSLRGWTLGTTSERRALAITSQSVLYPPIEITRSYSGMKSARSSTNSHTEIRPPLRTEVLICSAFSGVMSGPSTRSKSTRRRASKRCAASRAQRRISAPSSPPPIVRSTEGEPVRVRADTSRARGPGTGWAGCGGGAI